MSTSSDEKFANKVARRTITTIIGVALFLVTLASISTTGAAAATSAPITTTPGAIIDKMEDDGPPDCNESRDGQLWTDPWNGSVWQCKHNGCYWAWLLVIPSVASDSLAYKYSQDATAVQVVAC